MSSNQRPDWLHQDLFWGKPLPEEAKVLPFLDLPPGTHQGLEGTPHGVLSFGPVPTGYADQVRKNVTTLKPHWLVRIITKDEAPGVSFVHIVFRGDADDLPMDAISGAFRDGAIMYSGAHYEEGEVVDKWIGENLDV